MKNLCLSPQPVHEHGELAGHGDDGALERILATALGDLQSPLAQRRVFAESPEDVMGALHQQLAHVLVARFGDVELRVAVARLPLFGPHAEERAHIAASMRRLVCVKRKFILAYP